MQGLSTLHQAGEVHCRTGPPLWRAKYAAVYARAEPRGDCSEIRFACLPILGLDPRFLRHLSRGRAPLCGAFFISTL